MRRWVCLCAHERLQLGEDFIGTPKQILEQMQPFIELGIDYFMLDCSGFPDLTKSDARE